MTEENVGSKPRLESAVAFDLYSSTSGACSFVCPCESTWRNIDCWP